MDAFVYDLPVRILFGCGITAAIRESTSHLGQRGFVIADGFCRYNPTFTACCEAMGDMACGVWTDVVPNPTIESVRSAVDAIKAADPDFVIAIGGGSAIDTAKAACLSASTGVDIVPYHTGRIPVGSMALPLVAIPTTAGTGSEVTPVAVLSNTATGFKGPLNGPPLLPKLAIIDPTWTLSVPPAVTAATGMDALSHALEAYWSKGAFGICDAYAEKAVTLIMRNLLPAYRNGNDREARGNMALAAAMAGMAFGQPKNAAVHACSFPLTSQYGMSHGTACAFTLDLFLRYNAVALPEKLAHLARVAGYESVDALAEAIRDLKCQMCMPITLKDAGVSPEELPGLVDASFHPLMNNNPVPVTAETLHRLYRSIE
jgi:alcohol dehydrogenase